MLMRTGGSPDARATATILLSQALQTPRNKTHGNDVKVSFFRSIHFTVAPHLSHLSMVTVQSTKRAEVPAGNIGGWQQ